MIHWYETYPKSFVLHLTPLDIAPEMAELFAPDLSWIFTSATIAVKNNFDFYKQRMGLKTAESLQIESHYDFTKQAKLYLPEALPAPGDPTYIEKLVLKVLPVIEEYQGRTFFLFTSFSALHQAAKLLEHRINYPILIQGQKPKAALLKEFVLHGNAVLLGTNSFWEGVDVKGDALSCVIIDKLPFAAPNDPVLQARITAMRQQGRDPFNDFQLPQAIIALKQGVGRLIRDEDDTGMIVLGDPRLKTKPYGKLFLDSLPKMPMV
jgi:ATP-dependent DNA helicase DinG